MVKNMIEEGFYKLIYICIIAICIAFGVMVGVRVSDLAKKDTAALRQQAQEKGHLVNTNSY